MSITSVKSALRIVLATALLTLPVVAQPLKWGIQLAPSVPQPTEADEPSPNPEVPGYGAITSQGHVCAVSRAQLPLRYYSSDPARRALVEQAAATWNEAGQSLNLVFVKVVDQPEPGAIEVDWTGRGLPVGAAGVARLEKTPAGVRIAGIAMGPIPGVPDRKLVEVLTHEMGHTLGLDHSEDRADLMYRSCRPQALRARMFTGRDLQMLAWLYSRPDARPMAAR